MNSTELLARLHQEGLTAHQLRPTFVHRSVGILVGKANEASDSGTSEENLNPFTELRKIDIKKALRRMPYDYEDTSLETEEALEEAIYVIADAEHPAKEALIVGQYIGLGYTSPAVRSLTPVPQQHWHFLNVNFDEGCATGPDLQYEGLRFVESERLDTGEKQVVQRLLAELDIAQSDTQDSESFEALGAKLWSDITLRFLKNDFIEVGGPAKKIKVSLDRLGLMNATEAKPNKSFDLLLKMAKRRKVSSEQKHQVSRLRRALEEKFSLPGDPIHFEEQGGYVPNFKVIDGRYAADERAKNEAVFTPYDDNIDYVGKAKDLESSSDSDKLGNQDDYDKDYDDENDPAGKYLRENDQ